MNGSEGVGTRVSVGMGVSEGMGVSVGVPVGSSGVSVKVAVGVAVSAGPKLSEAPLTHIKISKIPSATKMMAAPPKIRGPYLWRRSRVSL